MSTPAARLAEQIARLESGTATIVAGLVPARTAAEKVRDGDGDGFVYDGTPRMRPYNPATDLPPLKKGAGKKKAAKKAPAKRKAASKRRTTSPLRLDDGKPRERRLTPNGTTVSVDYKPVDATPDEVRDAAKAADGPIQARVADNRMASVGISKGDVIDVEYKDDDKAIVRVTSPKTGKKRAYPVQWARFDGLADGAEPEPDVTPDLEPDVPDDPMPDPEPVTPKVPQSASDLMDLWADRGVDSYISENDDRLVLSKVVVPPEARGDGTGTEFMEALVEYADRTGKRVELTPSADFGGSKKRLNEFYKRFGFVDNKGRNKDYSTRETMYRTPVAQPEPVTPDPEPDVPDPTPDDPAPEVGEVDLTPGAAVPDAQAVPDGTKLTDPAGVKWTKMSDGLMNDSSGAMAKFDGTGPETAPDGLTVADPRSPTEIRTARIAEAYGLEPADVRRAIADVPKLRKAARTDAAAVQAEVMGTLEDMDTVLLDRPPPRTRVVDTRGNVSYRRGRTGEWDWFDALDAAEQDRIRRNWMRPASDDRKGSSAPDQLGARIAARQEAVGDTVDEQMAWWLDQTRQHDAARSIGSGRPPKAVGGATLASPEVEDQGITVSELFEPDQDDVVARIVQGRTGRVDAETQEQAYRQLGPAVLEPQGSRPWEMARDEWRDEVGDLEYRFENQRSDMSDVELARYDALVPRDLDEGELDDVYDRIRDTARDAGFDVPVAPEAPGYEGPTPLDDRDVELPEVADPDPDIVDLPMPEPTPGEGEVPEPEPDGGGVVPPEVADKVDPDPEPAPPEPFTPDITRNGSYATWRMDGGSSYITHGATELTEPEHGNWDSTDSTAEARAMAADLLDGVLEQEVTTGELWSGQRQFAGSEVGDIVDIPLMATSQDRRLADIYARASGSDKHADLFDVQENGTPEEQADQAKMLGRESVREVLRIRKAPDDYPPTVLKFESARRMPIDEYEALTSGRFEVTGVSEEPDPTGLVYWDGEKLARTPKRVVSVAHRDDLSYKAGDGPDGAADEPEVPDEPDRDAGLSVRRTNPSNVEYNVDGPVADPFRTALGDDVQVVFREGTTGNHKLSVTIPGKDVTSMNWHSDTGEIEGLVTDKLYQRRGMATALMDAATALAEQRGITPPRHSDTLTDEGAAWRKAMEARGDTTPVDEPEVPDLPMPDPEPEVPEPEPEPEETPDPVEALGRMPLEVKSPEFAAWKASIAEVITAISTDPDSVPDAHKISAWRAAADGMYAEADGDPGAYKLRDRASAFISKARDLQAEPELAANLAALDDPTPVQAPVIDGDVDAMPYELNSLGRRQIPALDPADGRVSPSIAVFDTSPRMIDEAIAERSAAPERMKVRVPVGAIAAVAADGRLKSQFETGTSAGTLNTDWRRTSEREIGGVPDDIEDAERPIYGYVADPKSDLEAAPYGDIVLGVKPRVAGRATMTFGDSLNHEGQAIPMTGDVSRRDIANATMQYHWYGAGVGSRSPRDGYTEVQYHGGLKLDDLSGDVDISPSDFKYDRKGDLVADWADQLTEARRAGLPVQRVTFRPPVFEVDDFTTGTTPGHRMRYSSYIDAARQFKARNPAVTVIVPVWGGGYGELTGEGGEIVPIDGPVGPVSAAPAAPAGP